MSRNTVLFGNNQPSQSTSRNLVEFRAGKMVMRGSWVHPDKRKGMVYINQSDDGLMHFCWKDRKTSVVEDDLIIFPEDVEFKRVIQCTTGRVFLLRFKSSSRKFFFWMQEPKDEKDEENCRKVNDFLNNPPAQNNGSSGNSGNRNSSISAALQGLSDNDMQGLLGNISQNDLMQLLVGMGGGSRGGSGAGGGTATSTGLMDTNQRPASSGTDSYLPSRVHSSPAIRSGSSRGGGTDSAASGGTATTTPTAGASEAARPATATADVASTGNTSTVPTSGAGNGASGLAGVGASGNFQLSDLQNILNTLQGDEQQPGGRSDVDLSEILDCDQLLPLLEKPEIREKLVPHLPTQEGISQESELEASVRSPQLRQAMRAFGAALATGELAPVIAQFDLGAEVNEAAQRGDVAAFAKAMQDSQKRTAEEKEKSPEKMDES